jgi:hypothetical protein
MTEWEYRIESIPLQEKWFGKQPKEYARFLGIFNQIGAQDWELVSYQALPVHGSITGAQRSTTFLAIFKRPVGDRKADWYPDPQGEARLRYWDGDAWTDRTAA